MQADPSETKHPLPYSPKELPRELARHYVCASDADLESMLQEIGLEKLDELFAHLPSEGRFDAPLELPEEKEYTALQKKMEGIASRNTTAVSFIGDGLPHYSVHPIVPRVADIRGLSTSYTPYQPERSQGTLYAHWIYQCLMSKLTGFEAINSSLYDRSTAIFEAAGVALRLKRKSDTVLIPKALYPGDMEVVRTLASDTDINIVETGLDPATGRIDMEALFAKANELGSRLAAIVFPQINSLGLLEDVDELTRRTREIGVYSVAVIDPILLATGGLKQPSEFGVDGCDMIVGDAQHLAIAPNFGGPGLGLFGIRFNQDNKTGIRQTPGRFVGRANDSAGRDCRVMVLSTREQHIRKDKATSNICSNQAFLATLAGASLLARGETGLSGMIRTARQNAMNAMERLHALSGVEVAFPDTPCFNEVTLRVTCGAQALINQAQQQGLHIGVDVSDRVSNGQGQLLKLFFSDLHSEAEMQKLFNFFESQFRPANGGSNRLPDVFPREAHRQGAANLPSYSQSDLEEYYQRLGTLNATPDDAPYPLGSCTMKYNPYINDWAANLPGFTQMHPQAPQEDAQGCLEVLHEVQEWMKSITGLAGVTTQPVAGAQGELVGLKMFQAYHRDRGEGHRNVILIPQSAHGTNFATAVMAGFPTRKVDGKPAGIVLLKGDDTGQIDVEDLDAKIAEFGDRLAGIMVTNPNTSGIFETHFKDMADKVHKAGGLVYMDGANLNAIAGWAHLGKLGVDAVHSNLHKTFTIPHGGGGPGDAVVGVSERLVDYLPGYVFEKGDGIIRARRPQKSIGQFHRHWGNFAHKVRALTYLYRLGQEGVPRMSAVAVLASRYLFSKLGKDFPALPAKAGNEPRMHEFILTLDDEDFARAEKAGVQKAAVVARVGKLFLDFGYHAPTVAWPETYGIMIEPTETYTKAELDRFAEAVLAIRNLIREHPQVLATAPHFTPIDRVDEVTANRNLDLSEELDMLPTLPNDRATQQDLQSLPVDELARRIVEAAETQAATAST